MQHYFETSLDLYEKGELKVSLPRALVSLRGIYQLFGETEYARRAFQEARVFTLRLGGRQFQGKLLREQGSDGVHYNLAFRNLEGGGAEQILRLLRLKGVESPWQREFPRIPTRAFSSGTEVPVSVLFPRVIGQALGEVMNFSCHGLLFEFFAGGSSLGEYVGQRISFELVTNRGRRIPGFEAKIMRIYDEMLAPGRVMRGLGVKFLGLKGAGGAAYKDILLSVCEEIRSSS